MCDDDDSDEPKRVEHCYMALYCCVWLYTAFVFHLQSTQRDESE